MPTDPQSKPRRRNGRAHRAILEATLEQIRTEDYAEVSIEGIARRAGVGKQTIYRWWPNKGALIVDALIDEAASDRPVADEPLHDSGDIARDIERLIHQTVEEFADERRSRVLRSLMVQMQQDEELSSAIGTRLLRPQMRSVEDRIRKAQRTGGLDPKMDPHVAVEIIFGPIFHRWLLRTGDFDRRYARSLTKTALRALAVTSD